METLILSEEYLCTFIYLAPHPERTKSKPVLQSKMGNGIPFTAQLALIAKSYTLVKQEDDWATDSENTFATQREMTRANLNQSLDTLIRHSRQHMAVCRLTPCLGSLESRKSKEKNVSFKSELLILMVSTSTFIQLIYFYFLITIFLPIAQFHFLHTNPHTTHNSSNRSDEGLMLETSAFKLFTVANLRYQLSC